jgi:hypothetical protein
MTSLPERIAVTGLARAAVAALLVVAFLVAGCAAVERDRRVMTLDSTTRAYQHAMRWGDFESALGFLPPEKRQEQEWPAVFDDLRITRYDIQGPMVMLTDTQATQTIAVEYLYEYNQVVRKVTDRQSWRWDDQAQAWWLESGFPDF